MTATSGELEAKKFVDYLVMPDCALQVLGKKTIISGLSILLSFGVAATIGLIFGITPTKRAASQDPIISLRHE